MTLIRLFYICAIISFLPVSANNLTEQNNSFYTILVKASDQNSQISLIKEYIKLYHKSNDSNTKAQISQAFEWIENTKPNPNYPIEIYRIIATEYYVKKDYLKYLDYENKLITQCIDGKDDYLIYSSYYSMGLVKTFLEDYQQAMEYFSQSAQYFKKHTGDYNHLMGYINAKRYQAICAFYMNDYNRTNQYLKEGYQNLSKLKPDDLYYDKAYYDLVKGMTLYATGNYPNSEQLLKSSLEPIQKNEDFANEGLVYQYLALNAKQQNKPEKALKYNLKIDHLFDKYGYSSLHLSTIYNDIIKYYKDNDDINQQLAYTNKYLTVINFLQQENKYIQQLMHQTFDTYTLEKEKNRLENELANHRNDLTWIISIIIVTLIPMGIFAFKPKQKHINNVVMEENNKPTKGNISPAVLKAIKIKLDKFEQKKEFLEPKINIDSLAKKLGTNRTYLTACIHEHKKLMFNEYINKLRIEYLLVQWKKNTNWRTYKFTEIANKLGYTNSRSFSIAFNKLLNQSPKEYLNQSEKDDTILI